MKRHRAHVACENVRANFLFEFFWQFKICQICISNKSSICTQEPKHRSLLFFSFESNFYLRLRQQEFEGAPRRTCFGDFFVCGSFPEKPTHANFRALYLLLNIHGKKYFFCFFLLSRCENYLFRKKKYKHIKIQNIYICIFEETCSDLPVLYSNILAS
jgi:hypothetical protein